MNAFRQPESFIEASTRDEAIDRIFSITGRLPGRSRGQKRAVVALRDAFGRDTPIATTNAVMASRLAAALGLDWIESLHESGNDVTLAGLNLLLEAAAAARGTGELRDLKDHQPPALMDPAWEGFHPAPSKIEAVTRIAALTGAPKERLGPGGKERKSVLENLADRLLPDANLDRSSKTRLAASIARALDVPWSDDCASTGETIQLAGLNIILAGAERFLGLLGSRVQDALHDANSEGDALAAALQAGLAPHWDGRRSVQWLRSRGLRGAYDNEWQGFYGEEQARAVLARSFSPPVLGPEVRFGNTMFDYALNRVWDIKMHTEEQEADGVRKRSPAQTLLNDEEAIRRCVQLQGLGFLVVSGRALMDTSGEFVAWHRALKESTGRRAARSNSGRSRVRKSAFDPMRVEAFWIDGPDVLDEALASGALQVAAQGRQAPRLAGVPGASRRPKLLMNMTRARQSLCVARHFWP